MRTTINIPDHLMKKAKMKAVEEGISLKELFTRSLEKELSKHAPVSGESPWKELRGRGSSKELSATDSGFEGYSGPDWNHAIQVNEPSDK
ncbi:MAG: hypothetical protein WD028_05445 [Balneolaceae bacterium]